MVNVNGVLCGRCGVFVSDLSRHLSRNRCDSQGVMGVKSGKPSGIKDRRKRVQEVKK